MKNAKYCLMTAAMLLYSFSMSAEKVEINGIWYNLMDNIAEVTFRGDTYSSYDNEYSGSIAIPAIVTYEGEEFSVTKIGEYAFIHCSSLVSVTIPEGVTEIGEAAFEYCSVLASITIPKSVKSIGRAAFYGCSSLVSIGLSEGVEGIGVLAFAYCTSLTTIRLPESMMSIGEKAFLCNEALNVVDIPGNSRLKTIGECAFANCGSLVSIGIPEGVKSIGNGVFKGCSNLTSIVVAEGNDVYDSRNASNCIVETSSNTLIAGCAATLIPESVVEIGEYAFWGCINLFSIDIPASVVSIDNYAFDGCSGLTAVTIGDGVTWIGTWAFDKCGSLTSIICEAATPPRIANSNTFSDVDRSILVYVPTKSLELYKSATYWNEFANIMGIKKEYTINYIVDGNEYVTISTKQNSLVPILQVEEREGYTFSGWNAKFKLCLEDNADVMLYSNAPCTNETYGDQFVGWHVLFDSDANTYFHSEYSNIESADGLDHYLRVDMGEGNSIDEFTFTYMVRGNDNSYTPTEIVVEGSDVADGVYTEIVVLNNLPIDKGAVYMSETLGNGTAYRYVRYRVTKTNKNEEVFGHPYFYFAEFDMEGYVNINVNGNTFVMPAADVEFNGTYNTESITIVDTEESFSKTMKEDVNSITYVRSFRNTNWQALYVPFEIPITEEFLADFEVADLNDVRQYDRDDDGVKDSTVIESFKVTRGTLEANYPYLIRAKVTGEKTITVTNATLYTAEENSIDCSSIREKFTFTGTYSRLSSDELPQGEGYYALSGGVWKPIAEGTSLGAFRFYLKIDGRNSSNAGQNNVIRMRVIDENGNEDTTGIEPLTLNPQLSAKIYDMQGRRVEKPSKGMYIVNGKKVVIK